MSSTPSYADRSPSLSTLQQGASALAFFPVSFAPTSPASRSAPASSPSVQDATTPTQHCSRRSLSRLTPCAAAALDRDDPPPRGTQPCSCDGARITLHPLPGPHMTSSSPTRFSAATPKRHFERRPLSPATSRKLLRAVCLLCAVAAALQHVRVFATVARLSREHDHHLPLVEPLPLLAAPTGDAGTGSRLHAWRARYGSAGLDLADAQFAAFYAYLPHQLVGMLVFVAVSRALRRRCCAAPGSAAAPSRALCGWYAGCGVALVLGLHGLPGTLLLALLLLGYAATTPAVRRALRLQRHPRAAHALVWAVQLALLVAVKRTDGFAAWLPWAGVARRRQAAIDGVAEAMRPWRMRAEAHVWAGLRPWADAFPLCVLRVLAFAADRHEATGGGAEAAVAALRERHGPGLCAACDALRQRPSSSGAGAACVQFQAQCPRDAADYTLLGFLAYALYAPLLLAGPLCTYNAFAASATASAAAATGVPLLRPWRGSLAHYAARGAASLLLLVVAAHYLHVSGFLVCNWILADLAPHEVFAIAYTHMVHLYLKFNTVWKLARALALLDGVVAPENMPRCYADLVSVQDFWRHWHASFYAWNVRYLYVPLGGRRRRALVLPLVFAFVALWHDLELRLLWWALGITTVFLAEAGLRLCAGPLRQVLSAACKPMPPLPMQVLPKWGAEDEEGNRALRDGSPEIIAVGVPPSSSSAVDISDSCGVRLVVKREVPTSNTRRRVFPDWCLYWVCQPVGATLAIAVMAVIMPVGFSAAADATQTNAAESVSMGTRLYAIFLGPALSLGMYAHVCLLFLPGAFLVVCLRRHDVS